MRVGPKPHPHGHAAPGRYSEKAKAQRKGSAKQRAQGNCTLSVSCPTSDLRQPHKPHTQMHKYACASMHAQVHQTVSGKLAGSLPTPPARPGHPDHAGGLGGPGKLTTSKPPAYLRLLSCPSGRPGRVIARLTQPDGSVVEQLGRLPLFLREAVPEVEPVGQPESEPSRARILRRDTHASHHRK